MTVYNGSVVGFEKSLNVNMDIYGDDIDSFFNNGNDEGELNENIREAHIEEAEEAEEDNAEEGAEGKTDENGEPIIVEPKKRSVRRPQVNEYCNRFTTRKNQTKLTKPIKLNEYSALF